jgi:hypothetical protein
MSKPKSEYNGIMHKLSIKYSLNSHPWAVTSWLQSVMLWGNTMRDEEYMCHDNVMNCLRLSFYAYLLFSLVLYSLCQVEHHQYKICTGPLWSWSYGSRKPKVLWWALGHKIGSIALGSWLQCWCFCHIWSGRWCWARGYNTTKDHEMNMATYDKSRCFCHIWICEWYGRSFIGNISCLPFPITQIYSHFFVKSVLFILLNYVVVFVVFALCLRSNVAVFLNCQLLIVPSVFSNVYFPFVEIYLG